MVKNKGTIRLSPSSLNLFLDCPRCFWLQVKEGMKRPQGPMASIAVGLDSVLKKYFEGYRQGGTLPPLLADQLPGKLALGMPKTLYSQASNPAEIILMGRPDEYLELEKGIFAALDHKTRASSPKEIHPSYQLQLDLYTLLLENNHYPTKQLAYLAYYFPQAGALHQGFPFAAQVREVATDPKRARELFEEAKRALLKGLPSPSPGCSFCNWHHNLKERVS